MEVTGPLAFLEKKEPSNGVDNERGTIILALFKSEKHIKHPEWLPVVGQQDCRCTTRSKTDIKGAAQHQPRDSENESYNSPWKRIRIDYFGPFWGQMFLIVVGTYFCSHRTAEPGVLPSETWSARFVMPVQPAPGECRRKYK